MRLRPLLTPARLTKALLLLVILAGLGEAVRRSPTASEVVWTAATNLFGFFTTPFVLEASLAIFGLLAVVTWNEWRRQREGDEWVYLPAESDTPSADRAAENPEPPAPQTPLSPSGS